MTGGRAKRRGPAAALVLGGMLAALAGGLGPPARAAVPASLGSSGPVSSSAAAAGLAVPPLIAPSSAFVLSEVLFVLVPQGPAVRVEELATGVNRGTSAVRGLAFPLPPDAVGAELRGGAPAADFAAGAGRMTLAVTVQPGASAQYAFAYSVSWAGGWLWLPVAYPTGTLLVLVPQGRWAVRGPGFAPAGRASLGPGATVRAYGTVGPSPGALLPIQLRRLAWWNRPWFLAAAAVAAAALAAAVAVAGPRGARRRSAGREAELVDALARLEVGRGSGGCDEAAYLDRRQELVEALQALHGGH